VFGFSVSFGMEYPSTSAIRRFFIVRMADQEVNDPEGTRLPGDGDALQRAKRLVDEIRAGRAPVALGSTMIVKNAAGQTIFSIPI
jgi:hypothetical protein